MSWDPKDPQAFESKKIRWEIVPYTRGTGLDLGCGMEKTFPHFIGVDNGHHSAVFKQIMHPDLHRPAEDLSILKDESMDFCFSSHLLEHYHYEKVPEVLKEWLRVLKVGGYLILYLPDRSLYPNVGEPNANPDHRWDPDYESVVEAMEKLEFSWDLVDYQLRDQDKEYSCYFVFEKLA